jgi:predicted GIY-YIG superfamily endonuclease
MPAWFYILRLKSGGLYPGSTKNKHSRYKNHFAGTACRTTRLDPPVAIVLEEEYATYLEAFRREMQVKRWTRANKEALIRGDLVKLNRLSKRRRK